MDFYGDARITANPTIGSVEPLGESIPGEDMTIYVDSTLPGSDSNDGESPSTPFLTIAHALTVVSAGDTIQIVGGTNYDEAVTVSTSGTVDARLVIEAYDATSPPIIEGGDGQHGYRC